MNAVIDSTDASIEAVVLRVLLAFECNLVKLMLASSVDQSLQSNVFLVGSENCIDKTCISF